MLFTYSYGLATITDIQFFTPKGNSYHGKGIEPKYTCDGPANEDCAARIASKLYGVKIPEQNDNALAKRNFEQSEENAYDEFEGGAIEWIEIPR